MNSEAARIRIKICGLTREADVDAAVEAGADAIGFVFYPPSPRYVTPRRAAALAQRLPPFVSAVGLFVNEAPSVIEAVLAEVPIHLLQFHGEEDEAACLQHRRPYLKAIRVAAGLDLVQCAASHPTAQALLLDAFVEGYGGGGQPFDWALIPPERTRPVVLSGGLSASNVGEAVRRVRPVALDVSSGVETAKGIKDAAKIRAFVAAVREEEKGRGEEGRVKPSHGSE